MDDRKLLAREMARRSAGGWEIVSQSDLGFQIRMAHRVSAGAVAGLVALPLILGVLVALFSAVWASAFFSFALVCAALLALGHLATTPKLLYISAEQLHTAAQASIVRSHIGHTVCSICQEPVRSDAQMCTKCSAVFAGM